MKMKNMLIGGMSLVLVACISIGGTLAYLTAKTGPVTNTFTGSTGISMTLNEAPVKLDENTGGYVEDTGERVTENKYQNVISNVPNAKDPTVTLTSVPAGGVKVYAYINGVDTVPTTDHYTAEVNIDDAWTKVYPDGEGVDGVYVYGTATAATTVNEEKPLEDIFTTVTFEYDQEGSVKPTFKEIQVKAFAIQSAATDSDALDAAKTAFGLNQ